MKNLHPVSGRNTGLKHKTTHNVISGANNMLNIPVLRRSMGA
jgi:hypothetical protein